MSGLTISSMVLFPQKQDFQVCNEILVITSEDPNQTVSTFMKIFKVRNNASYMAIIQNPHFIWADLSTRKHLPPSD